MTGVNESQLYLPGMTLVMQRSFERVTVDGPALDPNGRYIDTNGHEHRYPYDTLHVVVDEWGVDEEGERCALASHWACAQCEGPVYPDPPLLPAGSVMEIPTTIQYTVYTHKVVGEGRSVLHFSVHPTQDEVNHLLQANDDARQQWVAEIPEDRMFDVRVERIS